MCLLLGSISRGDYAQDSRSPLYSALPKSLRSHLPASSGHLGNGVFVLWLVFDLWVNNTHLLPL